MKPAETSLIIAGCVIILVLALFSGADAGNRIRSGAIIAAVKSAADSNKAATNALNVFFRSKEPYLTLISPLFNFISMLPTASPGDVLTIINPAPVAPVTNIERGLVNIFCSQKIGTFRKVVTGSGMLLKSGLVLTNAHVAAYPLVADSNSAITCLARTGSPAIATHGVKVLFISPEWVQKQGPRIASAYTETGENDYALLKITPLVGGSYNSSTQNTALIPLRIQEIVPGIGSPIKVAAYPANVLGNKGVDAALYSQTEQLTIRDLITFNGAQGTPSNTDVIETSPNNIGQQGSSGGIVADQNNNIIGLISTIVGSETSSGTLIHGVTIAGINKSLEHYSSGGLSKLILLGTDSLVASFNQNYRAALTSTLSRALSL